MSEKDRDKALEAAMSQIDRQFGKGSIMKMVDYGSRLAIESIPTGSVALDIALGGAGVPRGRVVEIYGPESSGKTTVCYHIMAEAQKAGGVAAYIDAEHAFDPQYAGNLGLDLNNLLISQPDNGEQALEIAETLVRSGAIDVVVVDSVAALVPRAEIEGEMGDSHVGLQARLMSQALRKLVGAISKSHCCLIFTNQIRMKIGVMYGNPETTTGGNALKFYASIRMEIRRVESLKQGQDVTGNRVRVKVVKNKVAPPFRTAEFDIMFNEGISRVGSLVDMGTELNVLRKSGAFYSFGDQRLGQGRENVKEFLRGHPEVADEIEAQIRSALSNGNPQPLTVGVGVPAGKNGASDEEEGEF
ncbi:MAG TPA: recombinase RecA [Chloroflexia bacterium]|jgi:recombination protein RecA